MSLLVAPSTPAMLTVRPWPDEVLDRVGVDPRSAYVERFWLPLLGPSSVLLMRRLASELERSPSEVELVLEDTARSLGLSGRVGPGSPFHRTMQRCCQFRLAHFDDAGAVLRARRMLPPLTRPQVSRLPDGLQHAHREWQEAELHAGSDVDRLRHRARHLALSLFELGEGVESTERQLHRWRFTPPVAREAVAWALARHRQANALE